MTKYSDYECFIDMVDMGCEEVCFTKNPSPVCPHCGEETPAPYIIDKVFIDEGNAYHQIQCVNCNKPFRTLGTNGLQDTYIPKDVRREANRLSDERVAANHAKHPKKNASTAATVKASDESQKALTLSKDSL